MAAMKASILLLAFSLSIGTIGFSQNTIVNKAESIITPVVRNYLKKDFQLLSVAIVENGSRYVYNYDNRTGTPRKITQAPLFEIGSISKSFSALILANAIREKRVKPDDDIRNFLDQNYPNLQFDGKPIELIHLVNLTSRLPNNLPLSPGSFNKLGEDSFAIAFVKLHQDYTKENFLSDLHHVKLDTLPGIIPRHSNAAGVLLCYILENIYHKPYSELLRMYILDRLKMNKTFYATEGNYLSETTAKGFTTNGILMPYVPTNDIPAFGLRSTIGDMMRFMEFQLQEKNDALRLTHQPAWGDPNSFSLGMNWFLTKSPYGKRIIKNDGTTFGFTTYILMYPELHWGVTLMTNVYSATSNNELGKLADEIFNQSFFTRKQRASDAFGFSQNLNELASKLQAHGYEKAEMIYRSLQKTNKHFIITEEELNNFGYALIQKNKLSKAIPLFKLNVTLHPQSWNVYDSYGEALLAHGQKSEAIKMYQKSIELNPNNEGGKKILESLLKQ